MTGSDNKQGQTIPFKSKVSYELVFLEAIKDIRKQRVSDPKLGYTNATIALNIVLLPRERKQVETYKLDPSEHLEEIKTLEKRLETIKDIKLQRKIRLDELKHISWPIYCKEVDRLYSEKKLEDEDFDGIVNQSDVLIMKYTALLEKMIDILKEGDWLVKGADMIIGGGGHGLEGYEEQ